MTTSTILQNWQKQTAVLATMHHKERVIGPLFKEDLGIELVVPRDFNTDQFGTFTRDIRRVGDQLETARAKARAAMQMTGATIGVASEGSFGPHPQLPFLQSNLEVVLLLDAVAELEIVGHYRTNTTLFKSVAVTSPQAALAVAESWGFPEQGVIVRQTEKSTRHLYKELTTCEDLLRASAALLGKFWVKSIWLETDLRAHRCPPRMETIKQATKNLIENCKQLCPRCFTPGFVVTTVVRGLPCSACHQPTDGINQTVQQCQKCQHQVINNRADKTVADPGDCARCNP